MLQAYLPVIVFAGLGIVVGTVLHGCSTRCSARPSRTRSSPSPTSAASPPTSSARFRFGISFYLVAMLFILFDIEVVFLYPVGVILKAADSVFVLGELVLFVVLLLVALVYVWRKGA